ncbi:MAG: nucleotidyltransferase family protein [Chloroflexi bacterium]|nr:nucleotidyltransferase family protein [Chloroflexota bacterium]
MDSSLKNLTPLDHQLVAWVLSAFPLGSAEPVPGPTDNATWQALLERAKVQGLSPLLYAALETHGFVNVPAFVVDSLQDIYRNSALATAVAHREMETLLSRFTAQQIDVVVLKGAALSKWLYPLPGLRPFGDLDLLIHQTDRSAASVFLNTCGYQEADGLGAAFYTAFSCELGFHRAAPPRLNVDLHWQLLNPNFYRRRVKLDWFWGRTQLFVSGPVMARMFDPTAQLVHLALHLGVQHGNAPRLIHFYDLALLICKYGAAMDWRTAAAYVQDTGLARPVHQVLIQTQAAWKIALAPETLALFRPRESHLSERAAFLLTTAVHKEASVLTDTLSIPEAGNKLRYVLGILFPNAAYMRQRYALAPDTFLPYYYVRRLAHGIRLFARSLWWTFLR